jgi:outer membrane protein
VNVRNHSAGAGRAVVALAGVALLGVCGMTEAGEWLVRAGGHSVDPKSANHAVVNVDSAQTFTFNVTYLFSEHWGVEVLAAVPFSHDIHLNADGSKVARTRHLPPTVSVQYHLAPRGKIRPYVGVGLNGTVFFDEKTTGALADADLSLGPSFGPAGQLGVDILVNDNWFVNVDARWIDIDTSAKLSGTRIGTVAIDPRAFGVSIGRRF